MAALVIVRTDLTGFECMESLSRLESGELRLFSVGRGTLSQKYYIIKSLASKKYIHIEICKFM